MNILVFPANPVESIQYAQRARNAGHLVVGASLEAHLPWMQTYFEQLLYLPHISETDFLSSLESLLQRYEIDEIVTSHWVVFNYLQDKVSPKLSFQTFSDPMLLNLLCQDLCLFWTQQRNIQIIKGERAVLKAEQFVPFLFSALGIFGQSSPFKLLTFAEIMAQAPRGDVIEIGVLWGRSLWMLTTLADYFQIGKVLGIDPWLTSTYVQNSKLVDKSKSSQTRREQRYALCQSALWPALDGKVNLLRETSEQAYQHYCQSSKVQHPILGTVNYCQKIAVLHIDGNHAYEFVKQDLELWTPHLLPGGWLILDDYVWRFGNGPQRAGDEWLQANAHRIARAFVLEEALFIQLAD